MIAQIEYTGNTDDILLFTDYAGQPEPKEWGDVDTTTLIPAFMKLVN